MIVYLPTYKVRTQYEEMQNQLNILKAKLSFYIDSEDRTIFSGCHSSSGTELSASVRKNILSFLNNPTVENWDAIYKLRITYSKALWDAWNKTQSKPITSIKQSPDLSVKWQRIPTPEELVAGINKIIRVEKNKLHRSIECVEFEMSSLEFKYRNTLKKHA